MNALVKKVGDVKGIPYSLSGEYHTYLKLMPSGEEQRESYEFTVQSFEVDPELSDDEFAFEWPGHTAINDVITNMAIVIPEDPTDDSESVEPKLQNENGR